MEWTETRTAVQDPNNPIAIPTGCPMYQSTYKVIPYEDAPAPYQPGDFKTCPSVYVEAIFRKALVKKPEELTPVKFLVKCLTTEFMEAGVDLLGEDDESSEEEVEVDDEEIAAPPADAVEEEATHDGYYGVPVTNPSHPLFGFQP